MRALYTPSRHTRRALGALAALLATLTAVTACGSDQRQVSDSAYPVTADAATVSTPAPPPTAPSRMDMSARSAIGSARELSAQSQGSDGGSAAVMAAPPAPPAPSPSQATVPNAPASMVIRSGTASVQVDSLETAIAALQRTVRSLGGYVGNTAITLGEHQTRSATIELKIPATRYEEAIAGLTPLGKVESVTSEAHDVGEEFVDLTARIANAKRLEARLIALLQNRTGRLQDALAVERELSRVREEIERIEGRARYLSARVSTSTLVVSLHERAPLVSATPGENILLEAAKDAWRNFVRFIAVLISSLGVLVPLGVLAALALAAWKRWQRAQKPAPVAGESGLRP